MSLINITGLTFSYEGGSENVFENVNIQLDTNWKLGLIGRNGRLHRQKRQGKDNSSEAAYRRNSGQRNYFIVSEIRVFSLLC